MICSQKQWILVRHQICTLVRLYAPMYAEIFSRSVFGLPFFEVSLCLLTPALVAQQGDMK